MKALTKEVKIALVAIAGVIILFFGMNFLKGLNLFSSTDDYFIEFKDISGLSSSCPIYADGFKVGTVKSVIYDYTNEHPTRVVVGLDKQIRIPKGSTAEIESDLMGNVKVNLLLANNPRERVMPGETISGTIQSGAMGKVAAMLPKLDSILGSLNALLADPALAQSLHNVQTITGNLTTSTAELNTLMRTLNKGVPTLMTKANGVLDNTTTLTSNLAALDLASTKQQIDQTLSNVNEITNKMNSKDGTVGMLLNDPGLYHRLNSTVSHADSLMIDLKQHPKRYVHFSVFGRKDK